MAISKAIFVILAAIIVVMVAALPSVQANSMAPASAPSSDGTSVDQGIAYVLMLLALVLTYIIHAMDASFGF